MSVNTSTTFTYSPLVAFIAIAETKNSGRRKQKPTKIAIHHAAGKMTGKQLATFFKYGGRYASANYCVGYDGDVALSVWEEWIPWTTSSTWCDSQAITIEISNSATGGNWPVSDKSLEIAIQLCVYICRSTESKTAVIPVTRTAFSRCTNGTADRLPGDLSRKQISLYFKRSQQKARVGCRTGDIRLIHSLNRS